MGASVGRSVLSVMEPDFKSTYGSPPMPERIRDRVLSSRTGTFYPAGGGEPRSHTFDLAYQWCYDYVGEMHDSKGRLNNHPLEIRKRLNSGGIVNASASGEDGARWENLPLNISGGDISLPGGVSPSAYWNRILAGTGPTTPKVNLPLFLVELKDVPGMIKHAGDLLHGLARNPAGKLSPKEAASATLAFQFGWAPLLQDLGKLCNFAELAMKRLDELRKADSDRGLVRTIPLEDDSYTENYPVYGDIEGIAAVAYPTTIIKHKVWGSCRWRLREGQDYGKDPSFLTAFQSALGLDLGMIPITLWKALPWTWFVDWYGGYSDYLLATRNMVFYRPYDLCLMEHRRAERFLTWDNTTISNNPHAFEGSVSPLYQSYEIKMRHVNGNPDVDFSINAPNMDAFKLSILGSLTTLSVYRRAGR